jgi:hypothetical protein
MSLLDALQVPTYSRYFKDILANKYEIGTLEVDHLKMYEQCSDAIANGLEKQKDPRCPTIPCSIGSFKFEKALCDLGASVSVMPRDVSEKLRLPLEPTGMCLELGALVFTFGAGNPPLNLGRPFLKTMRATIDVGKGGSSSTLTARRAPSSFNHALRYAILLKLNMFHLIVALLRKNQGRRKR